MPFSLYSLHTVGLSLTQHLGFFLLLNNANGTLQWLIFIYGIYSFEKFVYLFIYILNEYINNNCNFISIIIYYTFIIILNIFYFCPKSNKKMDTFSLIFLFYLFSLIIGASIP